MNAKSVQDPKNGFKSGEIQSAIIILSVFYLIAISFWLIFDAIFYLFNFIYIGSCLGITLILWKVLPREKKRIARLLGQTLIGGYLFLGLGCGLIYVFFGHVSPENMQLEGFWLWLFAGIFAASVMHYAIAKIVGPFIFGRGWCGWACWSAALFDLLPWKNSPGRIKKLGILRYVHFAISMILILTLVLAFNYTLENTLGGLRLSGSATLGVEEYESVWLIPELWWFLLGNGFYYASGIMLAFILKDNRAFCKYICPITCFLKLGTRYSLMKVEGDKENCIECKACDRACPMDIQVSKYVEEKMRVTSSECITCNECINACPQEILTLTNKLDRRHENFLNYQREDEKKN